jgi:hypothetical protein
VSRLLPFQLVVGKRSSRIAEFHPSKSSKRSIPHDLCKSSIAKVPIVLVQVKSTRLRPPLKDRVPPLSPRPLICVDSGSVMEDVYANLGPGGKCHIVRGEAFLHRLGSVDKESYTILGIN